MLVVFWFIPKNQPTGRLLLEKMYKPSEMLKKFCPQTVVAKKCSKTNEAGRLLAKWAVTWPQ
jgi:hypothetical protein